MSVTRQYIIAQPYAKALFEIVKISKDFEQWESWLDQVEIILNHPILQLLQKDPRIDRETLWSVLQEILDRIYKKNSKETIKYLFYFLQLLINQKRLSYFTEIVELFKLLQQQFKHEIKLKLISATELSTQQQTLLKQALNKKFNAEVIFTVETDQDLLSGIILKNGDRVIDYSLCTKINRLYERLKS